MPVIFDYDFGSELYKKLGSQKIFSKLDGWVVKVEIDNYVLNLLKKFNDDKLITQIVNDKGRKICAETRTRLEKMIVDSRDAFQKSKKDPDIKALREQYCKAFDVELKGVAKRLKELPRDQWNKLTSKVDEKSKEYKKYKSDAIIDIVVSTGGLALSAAAVGSAAASFGATAIPAIIATVRSSLKFAQAIRTMAEDAATVQERVLANIKDFLKHYAEKKGSVRAADVGTAVLNGVLGINVGTTVESLIKDVDLWSAKNGGLYVAGVKYARLATEVLSQIDKATKELNQGQFQPAAKAKMEKALSKLQASFKTHFENANHFMAESKKTNKGLKQAKDAISQIQANTPGFLKKMDTIANVLTGFAIAAGGSAAGYVEAGKEALKIASETIRTVDEMAILVKEGVS